MMGAVCRNCRHYGEGRGMWPSVCLHPSVETIDRVRGTRHPRLTAIGDPNDKEIIAATTDKCDEQGLFEPVSSWRAWFR